MIYDVKPFQLKMVKMKKRKKKSTLQSTKKVL